MRLFKQASSRNRVQPTSTAAEVRTEAVDSSEALSELLAQLNNGTDDNDNPANLARPMDARWLDTDTLLGQGKVHKDGILSSWVACQAYLTRTELEWREKRNRLRIGSQADDNNTLNDATRSGLTSRTSTSVQTSAPTSFAGIKYQTESAVRLKHRASLPTIRFTIPGRNKGKAKDPDLCQGVSYESLRPTVHSRDAEEDDGQIEAEWQKLDDAWRTSLHFADPITQTQCSVRKRATH